MKDVVEFTDAYYGAGAKHIRDYLTWFDTYINDTPISGHHYWGDNSGWRKYLPKNFVETAEPFFRRAMEATASDSASSSRVRAAYLPILFAKVMRATLTKPRILDDEIVMVDEARLDEIVQGAKLFADTMAEHGYNRWSEKKAYDPVRNVIAAFSKRHRICLLRNRTEKVYIAPTLGGRIVRWDVGGLGKNIVHLPHSSVGGYPYGGGYEEYSQFERTSPGPAACFETKELTEGRRLAIEAKLVNGLTVRRTFGLNPTAPRLSITSTYTNATKKPIAVTLRNHPEFDYNVFSGSQLYTWQKPGKWVTYPMVRPGISKGEITIGSADMAKGRWLFADREANFGLLNTFDLKPI